MFRISTSRLAQIALIAASVILVGPAAATAEKLKLSRVIAATGLRVLDRHEETSAVDALALLEPLLNGLTREFPPNFLVPLDELLSLFH